MPGAEVMYKSTIILGITVLLSGCGLYQQSREKAGIAAAMNSTAEQCLYDVRGRHTSFAHSSNCSALDAISQSYFNIQPAVAEDLDNSDLKSAQLQAWMAVALSNGYYRDQPPVLRIW